ncbi:hypothetical protein [Desulfofustis glycolicus]|uniref:hypothetical protein n=1 Tax=Desulfofustis glycolicus TaxID=51195 RepID=UPI00129468B9|nr:hypothetical protein [Desulfofustis glycolicus]MCB2215399.1 hypothetical protein [Desulfobulbaceae bacterium]
MSAIEPVASGLHERRPHPYSRVYMKIGGTGFNLSPAHFQKPTSLSDHSADFHCSL